MADDLVKQLRQIADIAREELDRIESVTDDKITQQHIVDHAENLADLDAALRILDYLEEGQAVVDWWDTPLWK